MHTTEQTLTASKGFVAAVTSGSATAGAAALGGAESAMPRLIAPKAGGVKAPTDGCLLAALLSGTDKGRRAPVAPALRAAPHTSLLAGEEATRAPECEALTSIS